MTSARFLKPSKVIGNNVVFRNASPKDASFILGLRTDPTKGRFLSSTSQDLSSQVEWLENYATDNTQVYFIIEDKSEERYGTIRLYDQIESSFCWGSWILRDGRPSSFAMESALMVYCFAFSLGFTEAHFDVRKANKSVWKFHERFGAERSAENAQDYFYKISFAAVNQAMEKYKRYLPNGIEVMP